jgi:hypothetical protein
VLVASFRELAASRIATDRRLGEAVVGILLRVDIFLWAEASTAHEIVGVLEHISCYAHDIGRIERVSLVERERTKDG